MTAVHGQSSTSRAFLRQIQTISLRNPLSSKEHRHLESSHHLISFVRLLERIPLHRPPICLRHHKRRKVLVLDDVIRLHNKHESLQLPTIRAWPERYFPPQVCTEERSYRVGPYGERPPACFRRALSQYNCTLESIDILGKLAADQRLSSREYA